MNPPKNLDIPKVVGILINHNTVIKNWEIVSNGLGVPPSELRRLKSQYNNGDITAYRFLASTFEIWVSTEGKVASIERLTQALIDISSHLNPTPISTSIPLKGEKEELLKNSKTKSCKSDSRENERDKKKPSRLPRTVEYCFLIDCTGSMQPYINQARDAIRNIVEKATGLESAAGTIRCAFIGYRDFGDAKQFETLHFTENVDQFKTFCSTIVASGGGDEAEDVFGGLERAIALSWSPDSYSSTKVIFHIADAPCHGREFHNEGYTTGDNYPAGDPNRRTALTLISQIKQKNIQYHFGKIRNSTDTMIKKFSELYGSPIVTFDLHKAELLEKASLLSLSTALAESR